jgi:hypothetical protein
MVLSLGLNNGMVLAQSCWMLEEGVNRGYRCCKRRDVDPNKESCLGLADITMLVRRRTLCLTWRYMVIRW